MSDAPIPMGGLGVQALSTVKHESKQDNLQSENSTTLPELQRSTTLVQTVNERRPTWQVKWQLLSACVMNFGNGMNDGAPGALIPYIEADYRIGYATVSLIFIANALGFIVAAPFTQMIEQRLGRARSYMISMGIMTVAYITTIAHPPFPAIVVAFFLLGLGMALSIALNNVFCANLANSTTALGCFAGAYGMGGTISPLLATAMVSNDLRWNLFYIIAVCTSTFNAIFSGWAFRGFQDIIKPGEQSMNEHPGASTTTENGSSNRLQLLKESVRNYTTLLGSLFIFAYQGAEVSISGWVVSFLISYRDGDPRKVGYVSAGFWAGITLGRFLLVYPAKRLGEKLSVGFMILGSMGFQLVVWLTSDVIGDGVAIAILGLLLGAVFPCATAVFAKLLPRKIQISSLSFVSALGSSGGAVFPFLTGLMAQKYGTVVLHPICLGLYCFMMLTWSLLPRVSRRDE